MIFERRNDTFKQNLPDQLAAESSAMGTEDLGAQRLKLALRAAKHMLQNVLPAHVRAELRGRTVFDEEVANTEALNVQIALGVISVHDIIQSLHDSESTDSEK